MIIKAIKAGKSQELLKERKLLKSLSCLNDRTEFWVDFKFKTKFSGNTIWQKNRCVGTNLRFHRKKFRFGVKSQLGGRVIFGRLKTESEKIASKSASVETLGVLISISASNFTTTFNSGPKKYCVVAIKAFFLTHTFFELGEIKFNCSVYCGKKVVAFS